MKRHRKERETDRIETKQGEIEYGEAGRKGRDRQKSKKQKEETDKKWTVRIDRDIYNKEREYMERQTKYGQTPRKERDIQKMDS